MLPEIWQENLRSYDQQSNESNLESETKPCIRVCTAAGCLTAHSDSVRDAIQREVEKRGRTRDFTVKSVGCMGLCAGAPLVSVEPGDILYQKVTTKDAADIVNSVGSSPVHRLECNKHSSFFTRQTRIVLENAGKIDPNNITEYIASAGYKALLKVLHTMSPQEVVEQVRISKLRGRGGAGYSTGLKWDIVSRYKSPRKFIICNADEGDPGAFMDRTILESDPHRVIEGMIVAGYAVGAEHGYIYIRAEYPLAINHLKIALEQAERLNMLGTHILGTDFNFKVDVRIGAGAYVCGEETALIASIEGERGQPRPRPPYPSEYGLWGHPTVINNVETFANIPPIIRNGGAWFAGIGTEKSKGTKVFSLSGHIVNTGVIEVPMGTTLREIIFEIGNGIPDGHGLKAIQTGGPTGGCIPNEFIDTPVDYESLVSLGTMMGSGGMIVMDDTSCMVDVARYFMSFCMAESCGQCLPCRVGTAQMYEILDKIAQGRATLDDLKLLEELTSTVKQTSLCGLGQGAPTPVLSTLRYFRDEYLTHILNKTCPTNVCSIMETVS